MKLQTSALLNSMSGALNGSVARRSKSGLVLCGKAKPPSFVSNSWSNVKSRFTAIMAAWAALVIADVLSWNNLAATMKGSNVFGAKFQYDGVAIFQRLNNNLVNIGQAILTSAPVLAVVQIWTTFTAAVVHDGAVTLTFAVTPVPAGTYVVIEATAPIPVTRQVKESDFRQITILPPAYATATPITAAYQAKYGANYDAGLHVYFRAYHVNMTTGQAGQPLQCVALIS